MEFLTSIPLTMSDFVNAALWAAIILITFRFLGWGFHLVLTRGRYISFDPSRMEEVRKRCKVLFPIENLMFNGATFTCGMVVRIVTHKQIAIEGEFVGTNRDNMLCLVTRETIVAQEIRAIETMQTIGTAGGHTA